MTPAEASLKGVDRPPAFKERATNTTSLDSRGPWTVVVGAPITVPAPASQILLHLRDCTSDGVSIIAQRRQQISSLDEFGNHLTGGRLEGDRMTLLMGRDRTLSFRSVDTLGGN